MDVALDGGQHDRAFSLIVGLFDMWLQMGHCALHDFGTREHERQLHLPGAEEFADGAHTRQQQIVDDFQRGTGLQRLVEVFVEAVLFRIHDAALQPLVQRQRSQRGGPVLT